MAGLTTVQVAGDSMRPTTGSGDRWLVWRTDRIRPGQLVAAWHPERERLLVVKRAVEQREHGWWLVGDNAAASDDSRTFGVVATEQILGRLLWRYRVGAR